MVFGCATDTQLEYELCESSPRGFYPAGVECRLSKEFKEKFTDIFTGEFQ